MIDSSSVKAFLTNLDGLAVGVDDPAALRLIAQTFPHYRWIGIYWLEGDALVLGPYVGARRNMTGFR